MSLTILMDEETKELRITKRAKIRQGESLVDKLYFLIPISYDEVLLEDFTVTLLYLDPANQSHMEILIREDEIYKDNFYKYHVDADSQFTRMAGEVKLQLSLTHQDTETDSSYVLHSGQITISVLAWSDYYAFVPDSSLSAIDERLLAIDNEIQKMNSTSEAYNKARAVDLNLTGDLLQLKNQDGDTIGDGVNVLVTYSDVDTNPKDGEIDLDSSDDEEG